MRNGGDSPELEKNCSLLENLVVEVSIAPREKLDEPTFSLYSILEEPGELTLAGESGKLSGSEEYWSELKSYLEDNQGKFFSIYSLGGGRGFDAIAIKNRFSKKGLTVLHAMSIDTNPLAWALNTSGGAKANIESVIDEIAQNSLVTGRKVDERTQGKFLELQSASDFLSQPLPRKEGEIKIFHLGNLLSVLEPGKGSNLLEELHKKMEKGDIASILCIQSKQFDRSSMIIAEEKSNEGLQAFSKGKSFFRTGVEDPVKLEEFLRNLGFSKIFSKELPPQEIKEPKNYKMHFIELLLVK